MLIDLTHSDDTCCSASKVAVCLSEKEVARLFLFEEWAPARRDLVDRQIAAKGGLISATGQFVLTNWWRFVERFYLDLTLLKRLKYGVAPIRYAQALFSFRNTQSEPNEIARCNPSTTTRKTGTGKIGPGKLATRSGLHPRTCRAINAVLRDAKKAHPASLKILRITESEDADSSQYEWSLDRIEFVMAMAKPNRRRAADFEWPLKVSSDIVVATMILKKMKRKTGLAQLARRDLAATGLDIDRAAEALHRLMHDRFFVKVGHGTLAIPELVEEGFYTELDGTLWSREMNPLNGHPADRKSPAERPSTHPLNDHPGSLRNDHSGNLRNAHPEEPTEWPPQLHAVSEQQEELECPEETERREEKNSYLPDCITISTTDSADQDELLSPSLASGVPPSAPPGAGEVVVAEALERDADVEIIAAEILTRGAGIIRRQSLVARNVRSWATARAATLSLPAVRGRLEQARAEGRSDLFLTALEPPSEGHWISDLARNEALEASQLTLIPDWITDPAERKRQSLATIERHAELIATAEAMNDSKAVRRMRERAGRLIADYQVLFGETPHAL